MIFSAAASGDSVATVLFGPPASDLKGAKNSQTAAFKNVFDALFEDVQPEPGANEDHGTALKSFSKDHESKKEASTDSASGTDQPQVLPAPSAAPPKPLVLSHPTLLPAQATPATEISDTPQQTHSSESAAPHDQNFGQPALAPAASKVSAAAPAKTAPAETGSAQPQSHPQSHPQSNDPADQTPVPLTQPAKTPEPMRTTAPSTTQSTARPVEIQPAAPLKSASAKPLDSKPVETPSVSAAQTAPKVGDVLPAPVDEKKEYVRTAEHAAPPRTSSDAARPSARATLPSAPPAPAATASPALQSSNSPITKIAVPDHPAAERRSEPKPTSKPTAPTPATPDPSPQHAAIKSAAPQTTTEPPVTEAPSVPAQPLSIETAPAPAQEAAAPVTTPASGVETKTEPAHRASDMSTSTPPAAATAPPDVPTQRAADRSSASFKTSLPAPPALSSTTTPQAPLLPRSENFAFAVRMLGLASTSGHAPVPEENTPVIPIKAELTPVTDAKAPVQQSKPSDLPQQTPAARSAPASDPQRETKSELPETPKSDVNGPSQPDLHSSHPLAASAAYWPAADSNEAAVLHGAQAGPAADTAESAEIAHANLPGATQAARLLTTDLPKTTSSSEILLHLTGNDQTAAAIRVADRAGAVNVSVHAADPVLRESLRSNLGELSTQLNLQGWKADVVKTAAVAAHSDSQQESHTGGERGSQQQQSGGDNRQPQRDRRSNSGQWRQEFDQQTMSGNAHSGGNR